MELTIKSSPLEVAQHFLFGARFAGAIGAAAHFGFADHLASGPKSVDELAKLTNTHGPTVHRFLRALAGIGFFSEQEGGNFVNTPLSEQILDRPGSLRELCLLFTHPTCVSTWAHIRQTVQTGKPTFQLVHGESLWKHLQKDQEFAGIADRAMTAATLQTVADILEVYDFSGIGTLCDVGGGHGLLLGSILAKNPGMRGILFDQPHVVSGAAATLEKTGTEGRCTRVGGSFFESIPEADAYTIKHIIHNWADDDAVRIFKSIREAAKPGSKLLVIEHVMRQGNEHDMTKFFDLEMLALTDDGRERTVEEYAKLLDLAGFDFMRMIPTESGDDILESHRR